DIIALVVRSADETLLHQLCIEYVLVDAVATDVSSGSILATISDRGVLTFDGSDLHTVRITGEDRVCFVKLFATLPPEPAEVERRGLMSQHVQSELARWYQQDDLLEPDTIYRLRIVTSLDAQGEGELIGYKATYPKLTQFAYFRTEGPPGLADLSLPVGSPNPVLHPALDQDQMDKATASVEAGSTFVKGTETKWNEGLIGAYLQIEGDTNSYRIKSVAGETFLTLTKPYIDADKSNKKFTITGFKNALDDLTPYVRQTVPP